MKFLAHHASRLEGYEYNFPTASSRRPLAGAE
jgi:hypothetical protein